MGCNEMWAACTFHLPLPVLLSVLLACLPHKSLISLLFLAFQIVSLVYRFQWYLLFCLSSFFSTLLKETRGDEVFAQKVQTDFCLSNLEVSFYPLQACFLKAFSTYLFLQSFSACFPNHLNFCFYRPSPRSLSFFLHGPWRWMAKGDAGHQPLRLLWLFLDIVWS